MKQYLYLILICTTFISCEPKGKNNEKACNGNTRRDIKILVDDASNEIDTTVIVSTIDSLGNIAIGEVDRDTPRLEVEKKVFQVTGKVDKVKRYRDGDYHIKLVDENENYLITEVPNPNCEFAQTSNYLSQYMSVIEFIKANEDDLEGKTLTITGVAFIDIDHYYKRDQAKNNMELHPILDITF